MTVSYLILGNKMDFKNKAARQDELLRLQIQAGSNEALEQMQELIDNLTLQVQDLESRVTALETP
jgi:hypothetical protein